MYSSRFSPNTRKLALDKTASRSFSSLLCSVLLTQYYVRAWCKKQTLNRLLGQVMASKMYTGSPARPLIFVTLKLYACAYINSKQVCKAKALPLDALDHPSNIILQHAPASPVAWWYNTSGACCSAGPVIRKGAVCSTRLESLLISHGQTKFRNVSCSLWE